MPKEKNKFGQYFTIDTIARFMVSIISHKKDAKVVEPSCGEGVFLDELNSAGYVDVVGYEIDKTLSIPFSNVVYRSFLSIPSEGKADVIIGNPPYIRWRHLEDELKRELTSNELWNTYCNSLCDYLFIFILKSIEMLNEEGELIFICSDYWINNTNAAKLREYILSNGYIQRIYSFKEAPLFSGVSASLIIFKYIKTKKKRDEIELFEYTKGKTAPCYSELENGTCFNKTLIPHFQPKRRWVLSSSCDHDRLDAFEKACVDTNGPVPIRCTLGDVCDIGNGMVSGLDKAFKIPPDTKLNDLEKSSTIKVYKSKHLDKYSATETSLYIWTNGEDISEEEYRQKYPNFWSILSQYKDELSSRYDYGKDLKPWQFAFPRSLNLFKEPVDKIFCPCKDRISNRNYVRFAFAENGVYPLQDVTGLSKKPGVKEHILYILAFLNHPQTYEWIKSRGIIKGDVVEFSEKPLASIPFRTIDWNKNEEVLIHDKIVSACRKMVDKEENTQKEIDDLITGLLYGR